MLGRQTSPQDIVGIGHELDGCPLEIGVEFAVGKGHGLARLQVDKVEE